MYVPTPCSRGFYKLPREFLDIWLSLLERNANCIFLIDELVHSFRTISLCHVSSWVLIWTQATSMVTQLPWTSMGRSAFCCVSLTKLHTRSVGGRTWLVTLPWGKIILGETFKNFLMGVITQSWATNYSMTMVAATLFPGPPFFSHGGRARRPFCPPLESHSTNELSSTDGQTNKVCTECACAFIKCASALFVVD
jgi:hypothetical protein